MLGIMWSIVMESKWSGHASLDAGMWLGGTNTYCEVYFPRKVGPHWGPNFSEDSSVLLVLCTLVITIVFLYLSLAFIFQEVRSLCECRCPHSALPVLQWRTFGDDADVQIGSSLRQQSICKVVNLCNWQFDCRHLQHQCCSLLVLYIGICGIIYNI